MIEEQAAMRDETATWDVRVPLRYGSKSVAVRPTEAAAREFAEFLAREQYDNAGLQIHTRTRTIYIDHED